MDKPDKKKYLSTRKKEVNLKRIAEQNVVASIPKLSTFFAKKQSYALSQEKVDSQPCSNYSLDSLIGDVFYPLDSLI